MLPESKYEFVALNYGRTMDGAELARNFGVTRQRIDQMVIKMRKKGFDIPQCVYKRKSRFNEMMENIKSKHPELVKK